MTCDMCRSICTCYSISKVAQLLSNAISNVYLSSYVVIGSFVVFYYMYVLYIVRCCSCLYMLYVVVIIVVVVCCCCCVVCSCSNVYLFRLPDNHWL